MLIAAFTQQNAPSSPLQRQNGKPQSARAESEDDLVKKRSYGGSCDLRLNPSRNSVPECETPWPRSIPAPETCFSLVYYLDAGHDTRDSKTRLATLALDGFSFIPLAGPERKSRLTIMVPCSLDVLSCQDFVDVRGVPRDVTRPGSKPALPVNSSRPLG
jgi:hypothetical protein